MKKDRVILIALIVVVPIVITGRALFHPETDALAWHAIHGSSVEASGIRFSVPILYQPFLGSSPAPGLMLIHFNGTVRFAITPPSRLRMARIMFLFKKLEVPRESLLDRFSDVWSKEGYHQTGERAVNLAGRQGKCREYSGPPLHSDEISFGDKDIQIFCYFGDDVGVTFGGTPDAVDDFYGIVRSAEPVKGNN
jgi:hypothetical protein